jgi:hypothetical protein
VDLFDILTPRLLGSRYTRGSVHVARALRLLHALRSKRDAPPNRSRYVVNLGFGFRTQFRCHIERP